MSTTIYKCDAATCKHRELDGSRKCKLEEITISAVGDCKDYKMRTQEEA